MPTLYLIHGDDAAPSNPWFPWLQDQLAALGVACHILAESIPTKIANNPSEAQGAIRRRSELNELDQYSLSTSHRNGIFNYKTA